jgi:hypothetical protein
VRACAAALCTPSHRTAVDCGIYSPVGGAGRRRALRLRFGATGIRRRARLGAGVTWTCRTASAPWAARAFHTSVVDAAGAIYVIGGESSGGTGTFFGDVWASTDGGARAGLGRGGRGVPRVGTTGGTRGYYKSTRGVLGRY